MYLNTNQSIVPVAISIQPRDADTIPVASMDQLTELFRNHPDTISDAPTEGTNFSGRISGSTFVSLTEYSGVGPFDHPLGRSLVIYLPDGTNVVIQLPVAD